MGEFESLCEVIILTVKIAWTKIKSDEYNAGMHPSG